MNKMTKSAFISVMALVCYAGFARAQAVSFDDPVGNSGELNTMVKDMKAGGLGGLFDMIPGFNGGNGGHGGGHNGGPGGGHNGPGGHGGPGDHNGPGNHGGGGHNPFPFPFPLPLPGPWTPQPHNGPWHPHHNGHPDWNNHDWNNNHWNNHGQNNSGWWNSYDNWWNGNSHPYSMYRTVCEVNPGASAKGFIVERTMPFNGRATFYYYNASDSLIGASAPVNGVYSGGNGTPVFDFYNVPGQADHCFLAITQ